MRIFDKCALYLMWESLNGYYKIGISKHPEKRRKEVERQYNVGSVQIVNEVWFTDRGEAEYYESIFHDRYSEFHAPYPGGREFFELSESQIDGFLKWMKCSQEQRAYRLRIVKSPRVLNDLDHLSYAFRKGSQVAAASILMFILLALSGYKAHPWIRNGLLTGFAAAAGAVAMAHSYNNRKGSQFTSFQENGKLLNDNDVPIRELEEMNLLTVEYLVLDYTPNYIRRIDEDNEIVKVKVKVLQNFSLLDCFEQ